MFKRMCSFVASALFMALLLPTNAHAIELTQLTPNFDASENLEIITPPTEGYNFELNILANDQTTDYSATIRNDHDVDIKVTSIDFSDSEHEFLDYSYDGIYTGDIIPAGSSKTISLTIKSTSATTRTITEDYSLVIHYEKVSPPSDSDNPNTSSNNTILTTVIILAGLSFAVFFVLKKSTNRRHYAFLFLLPIAGLLFFAQNTNAEESLSFSIKGKIHFTNVYTVTVNPNGGIYQNSTDPTTTKLREGETYHVDTVTRDTYEFVSWEVSAGTLDDNNNIEVHSDINIKALWNEIYYTLTIKPNGGLYGDSEQDYTESFRPNEYADILTPTRTGYDFTGWTSSTSESVSNNRIKITEDTTITANWSIKRLSLTINPNGGKFNGSTETYSTTVDYGTVVDLTNIVRDNHEFKNWTKNDSDILPATIESITITEDTSLVANWIAFYTVTINPNGGVYEGSTETQTNSYREGTEITIGTPSRDTYTFSGWNISTSSLSDNKYVVNSDVTFTATWNEITHTVTIDPNGGSYDGHDVVFSTTYHEGTEVQILTPTRGTYRFTGWTATPNILSQDNKLVVSEDVTLVANWEEIYYNLTIDPNGGTYGDHTEEFTTTYRMGTVVNLTTPTKEHHSFSHWQLEDESALDGSSVEMTRDIKLVAIYNIDRFLLTIDPNGGTYNGHSDIMVTTVDYGTVVDLTNTSREGFDLKNWTKNSADTLEPTIESITIVEDTTLLANWWSSTFYTVTVNPNGGIYDNSSEPSEYRVRKDETYTMLEATYADHIIVNTKFDDDTILEDDHFTVTRDITVTYYWEPAVARIERTQKLYSSIMKAEAEAQTDDIITLLVDTEEVVTNEKKITLDLNTHTVTGYLTNTAAGDITIINGEINNYSSPIKNDSNPSGAAVINNGILTIGVDDYEDGANHTKRATIARDNVRLIGSDIGLVQNNTFYFYDGFIEGVIGLDGSYNGSPWFRDTFDGVEIHYFPFVDHNAEKDCQHVELESSDRAVSKTINGGEIYYYNLQDNVDTSALTHYDIYIVRNFEATYEVTVPEDTTINLDLDGYTIEVADNWENNGTLNIRNSHPDDNTSNLVMSRTFTNNGQLNISDISASSASANTMFALNDDINITNSSFISETNATIFEATGDNATFTADQQTTIRTTTTTDSAKYPFLNSAKNTTINGGTFISSYRTIVNTKNNTLIIEDGDFSLDNRGTIIYNADGTLTVNGGNIHSTLSSNNYIYGINGGLIYFNGGTIDITNRSSVTGISATNNSSTVAGGTITVTSTTASATGLSSVQVIKSPESNNIPTINVTAASTAYGSYNCRIFDGGVINATAGTGAAYGGQSLRTMESGIINATSTSGIAYGITNSSYTINGGTITATSENNDAYGAQVTSTTGTTSTSYQHGGTVIAHTASSNKEAIGTRIEGDEKLIIDGGSVSGDNYGIKASNNNIVTLGTLDEVLNKDQLTIAGGIYGIQNAFTDFYDGTIIGGSEDYINDRTNIKAIPAGAAYHIETIDGKVNCWLVEGAKYIRNTRTGHEFNSLDAAYDDEEIQDGDTLEVIDDFSTEAILPDNTHNITLDLHGKHLTYSQPLLNSGVLTITDLSDDKDGVLEGINTSSDKPTINNTGSLILESGTIRGAYYAISTSDSFIQKGGTVITEGSSAMAPIYVVNGTAKINDGDIIISDSQNSNAAGINRLSGEAIVNGGHIQANGIVSGISGIYESGNTSRTTTINGGLIEVSSTTGTAYGVKYGYVYINQTDDNVPVITVTAPQAYGVYAGSIKGYIHGGIITATGTTSSAYGIHNAKEVSNATITVNAYTAAYGIDGYTATIDSGTITAHSETSDSYGLRASCGTYSVCDFAISGGTITATGDDLTKIIAGVYHVGDTRQALITGGDIYGDVYGYYAGSANLKIIVGENDSQYHNGIDDSEISPSITGGSYGLYRGSVEFYDGRLVGGIAAHYDRNIKLTATNAYVYTLTDGEGRDVCYVSSEKPLARIDNTPYMSIAAAVAAAEPHDTITLTEDNYIYSNLNIPAEKDITIDLDGYTIVTGNPITNNGKVTITNGKSGTDPLIDYRENNVFITNKSNAELTIDGIKIKVATNAILNEANAKLNINNATITGEDSNSLIEDKGECDITNSSIASNRLSIKTAGSTSITNSSVTVYKNDNRTYGRAIQVDKPGSVTVDNSQITILSDKNGYPDYAFVVANGSSATVSNNSTVTGRTDISGTFSASSSTFYHVSKYNLRSHNITTNGYMSLTDCDITMSQSGDTSSGNFTNAGTLILTDSDITTTYMTDNTNRSSNTTIYANNTTVIDNTDINVILTEIDRDSATRYAIYNKSGSTRIKNGSDIVIKTSSTGNTYGIYIENSTTGLDAGVTMTDSTLRVETPKAIGVYVPNGQFTMGEKETDPSKIGTDIANMSSPAVTIIGSTSGIGVQKTNGIFEFYDGEIIGSAQSITALPTETEYWYETKKTTDTNGYEHCTLDYMRNNPNANTNELGD